MQTTRALRGTRDRLLEAARYLFWEKGYGGTGMAEILQRAQANSGSFYHFFTSKEALLLAVLEGYLEGLDPVVIQPAFASESDPIERVFAILAGYRERLLAKGFVLSGLSPDGRLVEIIELKDHPWFLATQFHPEYNSRPHHPHPVRLHCRRAQGVRLPRHLQRLDVPFDLRGGRRRSLVDVPVDAGTELGRLPV